MEKLNMVRKLDLIPVSLLLLVLSLLIPTAVGVAQSKKDKKQAEQLQQDAQKAFSQKNYRTAIDKAAQSIAIVPQNAAVHFWKGYSHFYLKEYDNAVSELDTALSQGYKPLDVYKVRSFAKYEKKDFDGALADFNEGLKLDPNNLMFLSGVADINYNKQKYPEALASYQKAVAQDPKNPQNGELYLGIARTQAQLNNPAGQSAAAEEAIKRNVHALGDAYYLAGDGYLTQHRYPEAEQAFVNAISRWKAVNQKPPEMYRSYRNLGDIYRRLNRFDDAIKITKQAMVDYPTDGTLYTDISWYYSLADRTPEAIEAAKAGITLLPKEHLAYTNLCRAYNDAGQYQYAINNCNAALRLTPGDGETYFYLARAYDLSGKHNEATPYYERAVKGLEKFTSDNPDYSDGFYLLGNAYFADGQNDKAIDAYRKCLDQSPRFVKARYNLGIIYALGKNKAAAMEQYNSLLPLDANLAAKLKTEIDK
jgi:tetratricopeptide (TPR) repeat protein